VRSGSSINERANIRQSASEFSETVGQEEEEDNKYDPES